MEDCNMTNFEGFGDWIGPPIFVCASANCGLFSLIQTYPNWSFGNPPFVYHGSYMCPPSVYYGVAPTDVCWCNSRIIRRCINCQTYLQLKSLKHLETVNTRNMQPGETKQVFTLTQENDSRRNKNKLKQQQCQWRNVNDTIMVVLSLKSQLQIN